MESSKRDKIKLVRTGPVIKQPIRGESMLIQCYSVSQHPVATLLAWIKSDEIAIPEVQRPFVWKAVKVRDFIDSLYHGYPVGYLIAWRNPNVRLKDGGLSAGKRIIIDGQQRVTALLAALLGRPVVNKDYQRKRITIAFHPGQENFEVANPAICKDKGWISDIATVFATETRINRLVDRYCEANPQADKDTIFERMERLRGIHNNHLGLIVLNSDLDVETVTEIFVRINSKGVQLNSADFAMSKMAANETYNGHQLRKSIDYFCHLAVAPEAYDNLASDRDFANTHYFRAMTWLKQERDDLYDPSYTDMLRVAFTYQFKRGRLEDLVALLSGRNFVTRTYEEAISEESFGKLEKAILCYMNENNFKKFVMLLRSIGFINSAMIRSKNIINFAYILYLTLREKQMPAPQIEALVQRWFVMSILTDRYSSSVESKFTEDVTNIDKRGVQSCLEMIEQAELSNAFWEVGLPQKLATSTANNPYFKVFLASLVKGNDKGFLSKTITVRNLIEGQSNIHHVFPRNHLKSKGFLQNRYNQVANYVIMQSEINIAIGSSEPAKYFRQLKEQCHAGPTRYGGITDPVEMQNNLSTHCLPSGMDTMTSEHYDEFLQSRGMLIADKIRHYYQHL